MIDLTKINFIKRFNRDKKLLVLEVIRFRWMGDKDGVRSEDCGRKGKRNLVKNVTTAIFLPNWSAYGQLWDSGPTNALIIGSYAYNNYAQLNKQYYIPLSRIYMILLKDSKQDT